jgi:quaternary ammonium compound-resistance protein SugE
MAWVILTVAGLFEIAGAVSLKLSEGLTRPWPSVALFASFALSFFLLSTAAQQIHIGTAYAVWTGIGAAGTAVIGMIRFGESKRFMRIACLGLIIAGSIGLKQFS